MTASQVTASQVTASQVTASQVTASQVIEKKSKKMIFFGFFLALGADGCVWVRSWLWDALKGAGTPLLLW